jgi:hypothetical protein
VASTGEASCGGNDGAQWWRQDGLGQAVATGRLDHSARGRKAPIHAGERVNGEERGGWWPATNASMADHGRGGKGLTSGARLPERGRSRGRKGGRG